MKKPIVSLMAALCVSVAAKAGLYDNGLIISGLQLNEDSSDLYSYVIKPDPAADFSLIVHDKSRSNTGTTTGTLFMPTLSSRFTFSGSPGSEVMDIDVSDKVSSADLETALSAIELTPGPKGDKGDKGDAGNDGADGANGTNGTNGSNGAQGPSGVISVSAPLTNSGTSTSADLGISDATTSASGTMSAADKVKLNGLPALHQRVRVQTDGSGNYTWTYPTAFPSGVVPVIGVVVEGGGTIPLNAQINGTQTNTSCTIKVLSLPSTSVLGIAVLGVPAGTQAYIDLTADSP
jgi:hypothetical protein